MALQVIFILALIQGITEFLPISSSGHLVMAGHVFGWPDQGLPMDVAVHLGTLLAVMVWFWRDVGRMLVGVFRTISGRGGVESQLTLNVIVGTVPLIIAGWFLYETAEHVLRDLRIIGWASIGFGILLWLSDKFCLTISRVEHLHIGSALFIGCAQALALIPGSSRSGLTMTAGRVLGLEREEAARFSMLLSMPAIAGAGVLTGWELYRTHGMIDVTVLMAPSMLIAAGLAFLSGLLAISVMMAWLRRSGFTPFVLYRIVMGVVLLIWITYF